MISYKDLAIVAELAGEALITESDAQENDCTEERNKAFDAIQRVWDEVARAKLVSLDCGHLNFSIDEED